MTFYNEWDPNKALWLRQLMADGLIETGEVNETDIRDIVPTDLTGYDRIHWFAGIGGWDYAMQLAGWQGPIWTASCPCQPFSQAGRREGITDERHLFPALYWHISQRHPPIIVGEQVASSYGLAWLDTVFARLEATGYTCAAVDLSAASVGAPHIRQRLYWVAYASETGTEPGASRLHTVTFHDCEGLGNPEQVRCSGLPRRGARLKPSDGCCWDEIEWVRCIDPRNGTATNRPIEPGLTPLAHGVPARVVRISGYGDAIVPQVAAMFLRGVMEVLA
jgi:DNA (cytosine-5)-methyltransferase 1